MSNKLGQFCTVTGDKIIVFAKLDDFGPFIIAGTLLIGDVYLCVKKHVRFSKVYYQILSRFGICYIYDFHPAFEDK